MGYIICIGVGIFIGVSMTLVYIVCMEDKKEKKSKYIK